MTISNTKRHNNGLLRYLGIPLLIGTMGAIGAGYPVITNYATQTWNNITNSLGPEREIKCKYIKKRPEKGDNPRTFVNRYRGETLPEIETSRLMEILYQENPRIKAEDKGLIFPERRYKYRVPTDCKYK